MSGDVESKNMKLKEGKKRKDQALREVNQSTSVENLEEFGSVAIQSIHQGGRQSLFRIEDQGGQVVNSHKN